MGAINQSHTANVAAAAKDPMMDGQKLLGCSVFLASMAFNTRLLTSYPTTSAAM
jgi:hypothetical protein